MNRFSVKLRPVYEDSKEDSTDGCEQMVLLLNANWFSCWRWFLLLKENSFFEREFSFSKENPLFLRRILHLNEILLFSKRILLMNKNRFSWWMKTIELHPTPTFFFKKLAAFCIVRLTFTISSDLLIIIKRIKNKV